MTEKEQLLAEVAELEEAIKPKRERLNELYRLQAEAVDQRIKLADQGKGNFTLDELRFAATTRCECGAGFAYPLNIGGQGAWHCSDILLGRAIPSNQEGGKSHSSSMPFAFYEVKSEDQMLDSKTRYRDQGYTTRPEA